jgi:outer membrane protein TolC
VSARRPDTRIGRVGSVKRLMALVAGLALGLPAPRAASAQAEGPAPRRLTLDEALALASGENPEIRRVANSAGLNASEMRSVWLDQLLPRAEMALFTTSFTGNLQRQAFDNFGNPIANPAAQWNYFSRTLHRLNLSWTFQGPSLFQTHRRQRLINEGRDVAEARVLSDVQIEVQRRYLDALEQRALLLAEEELVEARLIDLDVAERLFSLALRTRVDVLGAELAVEQQRLAARQQETAHTRALLALRTSLGYSETRPLEVIETALPLFDPSVFDAAALYARALDTSPAVGQSAVAVETARLGLAEQKSAWWPQVSTGFDLYRQSVAGDGDALFDPTLTGNLESQFFLQFSIPVLGGVFRQGMEQQRASVELANRREEDRAVRLELEATIRGALLDLEDQWTTFRLSERSNEIAGEALRLAREEYRLGTRSFEDLRSSFQQEAETRRQVITARHGFFDAFLALEQAVGGSLRELVPASAPGS